MKAVVVFLSTVVLIGLIVVSVITLAEGPARQAPPKPAGIPRLSGPVLTGAVSVLGVALLVSIAGSGGYLAVRRRRMKGLLAAAKKRLKPLQIVLFLALTFFLTLVITALVLSLVYHPEEDELAAENPLLAGEEEEPEPELEPYQEPESAAPETGDVDRDGGFRRILLVILAAALFAMVLLFTVRLYRSRLPQPAEEKDLHRLRAELARIARVSLRDMLRSTDYRAGVIACYARMEGILAKNGFPRRAYQTPLEYMESTLKRAGDPSPLPSGALLDLTRLFEIAKFSTHPMSLSDRDLAVRSLTAIGERLAAEVFGEDGTAQ